jgi:hypothetical protein
MCGTSDSNKDRHFWLTGIREQLGWCGHMESWCISLDAIDVHVIVGVLDL